jgi:glycosyltransferase involved in cell wall biosynthesis
MKKVSCVIPAYNEENCIGGVLGAVMASPLVGEIIVVDDGSTDNTQKIVEKFKNVSLIIHPENRGKSAAVATGIKKAKGEFIFLLDADLLGLTAFNITSLVEPVLQGVADVSVSLIKSTSWPRRAIGFNYTSGERVLPKKFLADNLGEIESLPGFGLESFINKKIISNKLKVKVILWEDVFSPYKIKKHGIWKGLKEEIKMYVHIIKTIGLWGPFYQTIRILCLRVK